MHHIQRRLSPALILAIAALFVALASTAAAAVIITSPDQLAARVVKQSAETNPTLRFSVAFDGSLVTGDTVQPGHVKGSNRYDISFTRSDLGSAGLDSCAIAVSPWIKLNQAPGHNGHRNLRAYANHAQGANAFQVFTFEQLADGSEVPVEAAFDAVVGC
jgi:hypothetical protein